MSFTDRTISTVFIGMESEEVFSFSQSDSSSSQFECMKDSGEPYDIVIIVGKERIKAHRVVLLTVIPYFRAMFESRMKESTAEEVTIQESMGIDSEMVTCIIHFAYTSSLKICGDKVPSLFTTSHFFQLDSVSNACLKFLWDHLNPNTVLSFREYSNISNNRCMTEKADQYISENFDDVAISKEFLDILPFDALKQIIKRDNLNALKEETVYESVIRWVKAYVTERCCHLPELLCCIRMPLLDPEYVATRVYLEHLIQASSSCRAIVTRSRNYSSLDDASSPNGIILQKRYCERKHHLRCSKLMGYGMYSVGTLENGKVSINYHDHINNRWTKLCFSSEFRQPEYVACIGNDMHLIYHHFLETLNLKTMNSATIRMTGMNPDCAGISLHNKKIYFLGGVFCSSDLVHCLDPSTGICSEVSKIPTNRTWPGAVSHLDNIYVVGGYHRNVVHSSGERFNPTSGHCTKISSMHCRRWGHACAMLDRKLYVCGGNISKGSQNNFNYFTTTCEVYDTKSDQWALISEMNDIRRSISLVSLENKLYAVDEDPQKQNIFEVETYSEEEDRWRCEKPLTSSENYQVMAVLVTNSTASFLT